MLTSPTTVTIDGVAHSLSKINQDNYTSLYRKVATGVNYDLAIRHSTEASKLGAVKIDRHNVDLKYTSFDAEGKPTVYQAYVILRTPQGANPAVVTNIAAGLTDWLDTNAAAIVAWES